MFQVFVDRSVMSGGQGVHDEGFLHGLPLQKDGHITEGVHGIQANQAYKPTLYTNILNRHKNNQPQVKILKRSSRVLLCIVGKV